MVLLLIHVDLWFVVSAHFSSLKHNAPTKYVKGKRTFIPHFPQKVWTSKCVAFLKPPSTQTQVSLQKFSCNRWTENRESFQKKRRNWGYRASLTVSLNGTAQASVSFCFELTDCNSQRFRHRDFCAKTSSCCAIRGGSRTAFCFASVTRILDVWSHMPCKNSPLCGFLPYVILGKTNSRLSVCPPFQFGFWSWMHLWTGHQCQIQGGCNSQDFQNWEKLTIFFSLAVINVAPCHD